MVTSLTLNIPICDENVTRSRLTADLVWPLIESMLTLSRQSTSLAHRAQDAIFSRVHGGNLVYNMCWEDPRIDRQMLNLLEELRKHFQPCVCEVHRGYADLWRYMLFIGKSEDQHRI